MKIAILALLLLTSCATTGKYKKVLESWMGTNANQLFAEWGYPDSSLDLPNGNKVYTYFRSASRFVPGSTTLTTNAYYAEATTTPSYNLNYSCKTSFEADGDGQLIGWQFFGNSCKSK